MSDHPTAQPQPGDHKLAPGSRLWMLGGLGAGIAGIGVSLALALGGENMQRFFHAYLAAYLFGLAIPLGALFFVILQHLVRAGWSVSVRRTAEAIAGTLPLMALLALPILISVLTGNGKLYKWAQPIHEGTAAKHETSADHKDISHFLHPSKEMDELTAAKRSWLNTPFFVGRLAFYLIVWSALALWYWKSSVKQDGAPGIEITNCMQKFAPVAMLLYALTVSFAAIDLIMSLDPQWYSTIFGVYYFSGCAVAFFATFVLVLVGYQRNQTMVKEITIEHYHDIGKFLFAFVFFWGYIAFSQYMLLWYAHLPETTAWLARRGVSTAHYLSESPFRWVALALLFGHLLIPFAGLLSRHVKRNKMVLSFWCVWLLAFHYLNMFWLVMPEYPAPNPLDVHGVPLGLMEIGSLVGVAGLLVAAMVFNLRKHSLLAKGDPRLHEALVFQNI